ncbi:MAG TPA: hypothetical protein IGR64_00415 [Leptolyngbyaceae cyanobacterium M65_K2018_010]|nr:hypothetical protein [Leptolyngbyaceae cyanobacterium M65_K2018_010]
MTDTHAINPTPEPPDQASLRDGNETDSQKLSGSNQAWEEVRLPGQMAIEETAASSFQTQELLADVQLETAPATSEGPLPAVNSATPSTEELIQLIQDLNQCNDALLLRVAELEESLERSQTALQAEVERNQGQGVTLEGGETAAVPQQIAQLLSELDIANDGLRRTTIHNETLQAELDASQQRVAQLERECTLLQQRFSEKTSALQQAEDSCRDLKARLHRQQRYTLQFKAALEKYLNMAGDQGVDPRGPAVMALEPAVGHPVSMPKAQQILPWSATASQTQTTPSLTHLLNSLKAPGLGPQSSPSAVKTSAAGTPVSGPAPLAGSRPLGTEAEHPVIPDSVTPDSVVSDSTETTVEVLRQRPSPLTPAPEPAPAPTAPELTDTALEQDPWQAAPLITPEPAEPTPAFTEPSPWGAPLPQPAAAVVPDPVPVATVEHPSAAPVPATAPSPLEEPQVIASPLPSTASPVPIPQTEITLPSYLQDNLKPSPSPVVYPLRSQKKISSLAAVELPSFGRSARRS